MSYYFYGACELVDSNSCDTVLVFFLFFFFKHRNHFISGDIGIGFSKNTANLSVRQVEDESNTAKNIVVYHSSLWRGCASYVDALICRYSISQFTQLAYVLCQFLNSQDHLVQVTASALKVCTQSCS